MTLPRIVYPDAPDGFPGPDAKAVLDRLTGLASVETFEGAPTEDETWLERIGEADAIILGWGLPDRVLREAPALRAIAFTGIGAEKFVNLTIARERGIAVSNTPGYADVTVAEHTLALLLALVRHVPALDADTRAGHWNRDRPGRDLAGLTLGLVGFGGIAQRVAGIARALGMRTLAWTRSPDRYAASHPDVEFPDLDSLLASADVVSLHVAHTPETEGLIDRERLARLRPDALFLNTARGEIVDEAALAEALAEGRLAGAALDVFREEPLPTGHPLLHLPNVVLTPHVAYNTPGASRRILEIAVDNLVGWLNGEPRNVVT